MLKSFVRISYFTIVWTLTCAFFSIVPDMNRVISSSEGLHTKLRQAAQRINGLTKEREQLIKMGNKLRAELLKYQGTSKALFSTFLCVFEDDINLRDSSK